VGVWGGGGGFESLYFCMCMDVCGCLYGCRCECVRLFRYVVHMFAGTCACVCVCARARVLALCTRVCPRMRVRACTCACVQMCVLTITLINVL